MSQRRCPYCGELVTSNAITCPCCYKKIEIAETERTAENDIRKEKKHMSSQKLALLLAMIPGLFGFLGIGKIYQNGKDRTGWLFLLAGLFLFILSNAIIFGSLGLLTVFAIPFIILYILLYLYALALTAVDSVLLPFGIKI